MWRCGPLGHGLVEYLGVLDLPFDSMFLRVFSSLNDSMILGFGLIPFQSHHLQLPSEAAVVWHNCPGSPGRLGTGLVSALGVFPFLG